MIINRTVHRPTASAALAVALSAVTISSALAGPPARPYPAPAGKPAQIERPGDGDGGWHADGLSLNAADSRKVDEFAVRAKETEEALSPELRAAARISHATLVGFDDRLESPDALKRKVAAAMKETPGQTADAALAKIGDSVRYTLQWTDGRYTKGVATASTMLASWGNENTEWSNTWGRKESYQGIDATWRDTRSGHSFQVQFHTPASKWARDAARRLSQEQHLPTTPGDRAKELQEHQKAIFASVPVPEAAAGLRAPAPAPRPPAAEPSPAEVKPAPVQPKPAAEQHKPAADTGPEPGAKPPAGPADARTDPRPAPETKPAPAADPRPTPAGPQPAPAGG
ncbi:ATP nucleotide 3'-pyrophosphokinase [Streptomyces sp. NPDC046215]|uniref:ATP nucleotide 3'-pyrophosphokinase n=1 Tax=Streptomyces stramineus TaxID=173861 RepID=A0ABN1AWB1_9ACTN